MRAHMRTHPTSRNETSIFNDDDESIVVDDAFIKELCGGKPMWAVAISGYRYREDLTQRQLADMVGVKQQHISEMERGIRPIGKIIAKRLAKALNCDYRRFL